MKALTSFVLLCVIGIALSLPDRIIFPDDDLFELHEDNLPKLHEDGYHSNSDLDLVFNIADGNRLKGRSAVVSQLLWF